MKLKLTKSTKTTTEGKKYSVVPVRKGRGFPGYNQSYTGSWEKCSLKEATSFEILDDVNITRRLYKKRFNLKNK